MNTLAIAQNLDYQTGLLYFAHLLVMADGYIDESEKVALKNLQREEHIPEVVFQDFQKSILRKPEREIFEQGVKYLNRCSEQEKLCALVQLYRLAKSDNNVHVKEVRLILYSLKATNIEFEDVELSARMMDAARN